LTFAVPPPHVTAIASSASLLTESDPPKYSAVTAADAAAAVNANTTTATATPLLTHPL
jgi:hypothetical protein